MTGIRRTQIRTSNKGGALPGPLGWSSKFAILMILGFTTAACGVSSEDTPRRIDPAAVPYDLLNRANDSARASPAPTTKVATPQVYFVQGNAKLAGLKRDIAPDVLPGERLRSIIAALTDGPTTTERLAGLSSAVPPGLDLSVTRTAGGQASIELSGQQVPSGDQSILAVAQIVLTATSVPGITSVVLTRDGKPIEAPLGDGALVGRPLVASDYATLVADARPSPTRD